MRSMVRIALLILFPLAARSQEPAHNFEYDQKAPLDVQEAGVSKRGDVSIHDISYASPKSGRVPAYLVVPSGKGPFAAVIWGHWYWANSAAKNRSEFLDEAVALAPSGVVSLLTTGPIARPGHVNDKDPLSEQQVRDLIQQVVDVRRGVDLLAARKDVDPKRIAYVGHSYNAAVGAFLSGAEHSFNAFVLMAGALSDEVDRRSTEFKQFREKVGPAKFDAHTAKYGWLDPGKFVSHAAPAFVFLQYGTHDDPFFSRERVGEYAANVSEPKKLQWYDAPHSLNAEARRDRIAFLVEQLHLKPVPPERIAAVPELYQPADQGQ
jgi:dienelactone hydrolase